MNTQVSQKAPGRNDPCPCGSGKKYKKCCMQKELSAVRAPISVHPDLPRAVQAFESGDAATAREICSSILSVNPEDPAALHIAGLAEYQLGNTDAAESALYRSLQSEPNDSWVNNNLAFILQEQAKLDEAYKYAQKAIELDGKNAEACNTLGLICRKNGKLLQARKLFETAIQLNKKNVQYWTNLGEVLMKAGNFSEAQNAFETAIKLVPDFVPALNNLGVSLNRQKKFTEALSYLEKANKFTPGDAEILTNIGLTNMGLNEFEAARTYFTHALEVDSRYANAYINLGELSMEAGNSAEAQAYFQKAIESDSGSAQAHKRYADSLIESGSFNEAYDQYLAALELDPSYVEGAIGLSRWFTRQDEHEKAIETLNKAVAQFGDSAMVYAALAESYKGEFRLKDALAALKNASKSGMEPVAMQLKLAEVYKHFGMNDEARSSFLKASQLDPDRIETYLAWANFEEHCSKLDEANALLDKIIELNPHNEKQTHILRAVILRRNKKLESALEEIDKASIAENETSDLAKKYFFEKANIYDKLGAYESAFPLYEKAARLRSQLQNGGYNPENLETRIDDEITFFSKKRLEELPRVNTQNEAVRPIFIVGFPRSGTTLLEQILCSHPRISAGDELTFIPEIRKKICEGLGSNDTYPVCLQGLDLAENPQAVLLKWRKYYMERASELGVVGGGHYFTDKLPGNLSNLPLISMLFPDSPIIHIMRNPMDSALSAMFSNFSHGMDWANNIENAAHYFLQSMKLVDHVRDNMKLNYMLVRYEDLVADQEKWTREIIGFLGEEWDERVLEFHKTERVARTASYAQVNQKIYTSSVARYKRYEKFLARPLEILKPLMQQYDYLV